jgi:hypothetical protein
MFFWVFPRRQFIVGRRFGTLYQFHLQRLEVDSLLPAFEDGTDTGFRNVSQLQFDAGEIPKRTYTRLQIFVNKCVRRIINIKWTDKITNNKLWRSQQKPKENHIKKKKMQLDWTHITQRSKSNRENSIKLGSLGI